MAPSFESLSAEIAADRTSNELKPPQRLCVPAAMNLGMMRPLSCNPSQRAVRAVMPMSTSYRRWAAGFGALSAVLVGASLTEADVVKLKNGGTVNGKVVTVAKGAAASVAIETKSGGLIVL